MIKKIILKIDLQAYIYTRLAIGFFGFFFLVFPVMLCASEIPSHIPVKGELTSSQGVLYIAPDAKVYAAENTIYVSSDIRNKQDKPDKKTIKAKSISVEKPALKQKKTLPKTKREQNHSTQFTSTEGDSSFYSVLSTFVAPGAPVSHDFYAILVISLLTTSDYYLYTRCNNRYNYSLFSKILYRNNGRAPPFM